MAMADMCDVTGATAEQKAAAAGWNLWQSATHPMDAKKQFPFDYATNFQERVVVLSGKAELTPDDGSPVVTIKAGDYVVFHQGFACMWRMVETMEKMYCYFDENGEETVSNSIACDLCSQDCSAESYLMDGEVDLCPACFESKGADYKAAERCENGKEVGKVSIPKKQTKKKKAGGGGAKKKIAKKK